jgi:hypothetical protein
MRRSQTRHQLIKYSIVFGGGNVDIKRAPSTIASGSQVMAGKLFEINTEKLRLLGKYSC